MKKIKILFFITELSIGGAQNALLRLISGLDRESYEPYVTCLYNGDGIVAKSILQLGIPVEDLEMHSKWTFFAFIRLFRHIRYIRPSILHTWMFHANIPGRVIGRLAGVPIIISSERTMGMESRFRLWLNHLTISLVNQVTCVSQNVAEFAIRKIKIPKEKITVIYNGIDVDRYEQTHPQREIRGRYGLPEGILIGTVSRAHPVKGLTLLLEAFNRVLIDHPQVHLIHVGGGPQLSLLQKEARELGIERSVIFLGEMQEIPNLLTTFDIFVLPSLFEGMPNAVLEAMASGLPVIATNVGGTPEIISDGVSGLLVPPGNVEALTEAMVRLCDDSGLREELGLAAYARVKRNFSQDEMVRKTEKLYQDLFHRLTDSFVSSSN